MILKHSKTKYKMRHGLFFIACFFVTFLFAASPVQAKKVKMKTSTQLIDRARKDGDQEADQLTKNVVKRLEQGEMAYVGTKKQVYKVVDKINKYYKGNYADVYIVDGGLSSIYYEKCAKCPYRGLSEDKIYALENDPDGDPIYYLKVNEKWSYDAGNSNSRYRNRAYWKMVKEAVKKAGVKNGMTDRVAVKKITKWICKHTRYKIIKEWNCITGVLYTKGVGQCEDYADAFWAMCQVCGIPARKISGKADGGSHAWNRVMIRKKWYWIDTTWIDTSGMEKYDLTRKLWKDHVREKLAVRSIY